MNKNTRLTKNFIYGEFWCRGIEPPEKYFENIVKLAQNLQLIRDHFKKPVIITSGYRTPEHNKAVGGAKNSQHLYGKAADIKIIGVKPQDIMEAAQEITNFKGYGLSKYFIHLDLRNKYSFWTY